MYASQETTVRTGHGTADWFQIGKSVRQGCILSPCLFNLYAEYIMRNTGLEEAQAEIMWWAPVLLVSLTLLGINLKSFQLSYVLQFLPSAV